MANSKQAMENPNYPNQDRLLGLPDTILPDGRKVTRYCAPMALRMCELIALGRTLNEITEKGNEWGFVAKSTFIRWAFLHPELDKAYKAARELSAETFEEDALDLGRRLVKDPGGPAKVAAYRTLIEQLRWSASRRDPTKYGERTAVSIRVPVQINTNVDLGQEGGRGIDVTGRSNVYEVTAKVDGVPVEATLEDARSSDRHLLSPPERRTSNKVKLRPRIQHTVVTSRPRNQPKEPADENPPGQ